MDSGSPKRNERRCSNASRLERATEPGRDSGCTSCDASPRAMAVARNTNRRRRGAAVSPSFFRFRTTRRMAERIRVIVVEDHALTRAGLVTALARDSAFEVVGEAADGPSGFELATAVAPDVAVIDIGLPGEDGMALT